jgi:hypothetical protein
MAVRFIPKHFTFSSPGTQSGFAEFGNTVRTAGAAVQGYAVTFGGSDHHLRDLTVAVSNVTDQGTGVSFDVTFQLVDGSNNKGRAEIDVVVIGDVEST